MDKRGISELVTAIIIILLVLSAVVIVWRVVMPLIRETGEKVEVDTLGLIHTANLKINNLLQEEGKTTIDFGVQYNGDVPLNSLILIMYGINGESLTKELKEPEYSNTFPVLPLESRDFQVNYSVNSLGTQIVKIQIYPTIKLENKEIVLKASIKEEYLVSSISQGTCTGSINHCSGLSQTQCGDTYQLGHPLCMWSTGGNCVGWKEDSCNTLTEEQCGSYIYQGYYGCSWTSEEGRCFFNDNHRSCDEFYADYEGCVDLDYCGVDVYCEPKNYIDCYAGWESEENCESIEGCEWRSDYNYCEQKPCYGYSRDDCNSDSDCMWFNTYCDNVMNKCWSYWNNYDACSNDLDCMTNIYCYFVDGSNDCNWLSDPEQCEDAGCTWKSSVCSGDVSCSYLTCYQYRNKEAECVAAGCEYNKPYANWCGPSTEQCNAASAFGCSIQPVGCSAHFYFNSYNCNSFSNNKVKCEDAGCTYCDDPNGCSVSL